MLILRKEAEDDLKKAYEWYEEKRARLGVEFVYEVESAFEIIREKSATVCQGIKDVRRVLCSRFPYLIYFFERKSDTVVIGVLHQRRNPVIWQARR